MIDLQKVIYERMSGDSDMMLLIATGVGIFNDGTVPPDFQYNDKPIAVIEAPVHNSDIDTFDENIRDETIGIIFIHKPQGNTLPITLASETARKLFKNWGPVDIDDGRLINCTVSGPVPVQTRDPTLGARAIYVNLIVKENEE